MARNARKNIEGNYFHVMVQGIGKEYVFPTNDCKGYYLSCLQKAQENQSTKILGFCVMGNHAHILVEVESTSELSAYFKQVNSLYANYYNRINNRVGYVFRGRFKSELITDTSYLKNCLAYIQNNPLKARIVERAEDYGYSSYANYISGGGLVDFASAKKHYDISAENITAIMQELTDTEWLEHEEEREDKDKVFRELKKRYKIKQDEKIKDIKIAAQITQEMQQRCGVTIKEMSRMLEVGRESLRKEVVANTVP